MENNLITSKEDKGDVGTDRNAPGDSLSRNKLRSSIYLIRSSQVMVDRDLAKLYGVETKRLNEAVKRNRERFPERFMFQLTTEEYSFLRSQFATLDSEESFSGNRGQHTKYLPYVFTEQGITQLSTVLRSKTAIEVSIKIMDAFIEMRHFLSSNAGLFQRIEKLECSQLRVDEKFDYVLERLNELAPSLPAEQLFATGCVWDAWSYISRLVRSANERIILIDNFVDDRVLTLLSKRKNRVLATIHSRYSESFMLDMEKYNAQHENVLFCQLSQKIHDRFLIIDDEVYLLGASVKDMGMSLCAVTKMVLTPDIVLSLLK